MGLKILHTADWHLGAAFSGFDPEQRQFLLGEQKKLPGKMADMVHQMGCSLVLLAGDVFDVPIPAPSWVTLVKQAFAEMKVPVLIAPGNHDHCCPGSPWLEEAWPENVHIFTGGVTSVSLPELDCRVWGAGYQSMECAPLLENFHAEGPERYQIGLFHADPLQRNSSYCPVTGQQMAQSGLSYLALGHIHKAGSMAAGSTRCAWPGCPMGRGWDETGEKGVLLVELEEQAEVTPILLDTPRFYDLEVEASGLLRAISTAASRDFYRITLVGEDDRDLGQIEEILTHLPNRVLRDRREKPVDLWADVGQDTLRGVYFSLLQQQGAELTARLSHSLLRGKEVDLG